VGVRLKPEPPAAPSELARGARLVGRRDPAMAALIRRAGPVQLRDPLEDSFAALVRSIMYQQLAGAAAAIIHGRFLNLFDRPLSPDAVLALPEGAMRSAGVSGAKAAAITDLSIKVGDGTVPLHDVDALSDDELVARLVQVRGIGRWTAEMFLIFQLRRLDVWPVDDYGVRKGWAMVHRLKEPPAPRVLQAEGDRFRPFRSIAAWYCWRAIDTPPEPPRRKRKA
ncbi:MAG TPA: DNA-3-methyladenine glycosylase 2 family protein, partial [Patescibacteria group bacterium]|nr:DNA-3-methyladenine glycosylase 2 family protein [Patescibacteria group bacterium]